MSLVTIEKTQNPSLRFRFLSWIYRIITGTASRLVMPLVFRGVPGWGWRVHLDIESKSWTPASGRGLIWFHAASAGELEMLWGVARELRELPQFSECRFGLTVFSPSGRTRLERFRSEFSPIYCGPSPGEGEWSLFFEQLERRFGELPSVFITAKYESWPELWGTLLDRRITLAMVNAEWRRSLQWCSRITRAIFGSIPRSIFLTVSDVSSREILRFIPEANSCRSGDPRWDQIVARLERPQSRILELRELGERMRLPRPWVVVGSAWDEDVDFLLKGASSNAFAGTFWIVPHRPSGGQLRAWSDRVSPCGQVWLSTPDEEQQARSPELRLLDGRPLDEHPAPPTTATGFNPGKRAHFVLVQEMGILAELYSVGDAAWVGGGFRTGLHSVIEPSLSNLWIGAGALRTAKFPEVPELVRLGQLELMQSSSEIEAWLRKIADKPVDSTVSKWCQWRTDTHLGASRRVAHHVAEIVTRLAPV
jgi:3-deoxy-D-manno-octulosonic-acid transferase